MAGGAPKWGMKSGSHRKGRGSAEGRLRRFERGPENVGSWHSRVQRTYLARIPSCFVQGVVHSGHFRVVTPNWDDCDCATKAETPQLCARCFQAADAIGLFDA